MHARLSVGVPFFGIVALAGLLMFVLVHDDSVDNSRALHVLSPRQASSAAVNVNTSPAAATSQAASTQQAATSNTPAASSTQQQQQQQPQQSTTTPSNPSSAAQQSTTQAAQSTNTPNNSPSSSATAAPSLTSAVVTTDPGGQVVTSIVFVSNPTASSSSASPSGTAASSNSGSSSNSGISTSTIIGLSVAGGVAVLCVVGFFVWKFTRKRLGDFDNNEEIKWPELNTHDTVPLPTNRTGGAGFDTAPDAARRSSVGYTPSTAANSTAELHPDPYAIPPLPHLDPNQPYRDDPNTSFYDPYRGPVPPSFEQTIQGGEAIPMTQLAGRRSPGPGAAYGGDFGSGRASPGLHAAYGAPPDIGGRVSPAPPAAYGTDFGGRASPSLRAPYAGGRMSPGPQAAYGNAYGPR